MTEFDLRASVMPSETVPDMGGVAAQDSDSLKPCMGIDTAYAISRDLPIGALRDSAVIGQLVEAGVYELYKSVCRRCNGYTVVRVRKKSKVIAAMIGSATLREGCDVLQSGN